MERGNRQKAQCDEVINNAAQSANTVGLDQIQTVHIPGPSSTLEG